MINESMHAINISYVLHERSDSRSVRRACRDSRRFFRHRRSLLARFDGMSDAELDEATLVTPRLRQDLASRVRPGFILTATIGLPELIRRVTMLKLPGEPSHHFPSPARIDDAESGWAQSYVQLFRGEASLPDFALTDPHRPVLVAALPVRPGNRSLQLAGRLISIDELPSQSTSLLEAPQIRHTLEILLRDYVEQWCPSRALWNQPAEAGLDDLGTTPAKTD